MPPSGGTPGNTTVSGPLTDFVRDYLTRTGESERALAGRSRDPVTTTPIRHGWINDLVNGRLEQAPKLMRLRALAAGMGVPERKVSELAAAQWLGVQVAEVESDGAVVTVTLPPDASPVERERFRRMMQDAAKHIGT